MDAVRASYDAVAGAYAEEIGGELAGKPIDRGLLAALVELVGDGVLADVGCGPGHVTAYLDALGGHAIGVDLSPGMIAAAQARHPHLHFTVGDLIGLPAVDSAWGGALCAYSIIHLDHDERTRAYTELARVIRPGGWLLVSFHVADLGKGIEPGGTVHLEHWWGHDVDLDFYFLDPAEVSAGLDKAGFDLMARTDREPHVGGEAPTRRCYLLARRREPDDSAAQSALP